MTSFGLIHDNLTVRKDTVRELCHHILDSGEKYEWYCSSRTDTIDRDLMGMMKEAGCKGIFFGVETGSQIMQRLIGKRLKVDMTRETLQELVSVGIDATASFIIGFPEETVSELEETLSLALQLRRAGIREVQLHPLTALPGTQYMANNEARLQFHQDLLSFHDITLVSEMTDVEMEWVKRFPRVFSNFYAVPPLHYPLSLVHQTRGCYFYLMQVHPHTLYGIHKLGRLRHTELVNLLTDKLPPQFDQWTPETLLLALEAVVADLPGELARFIKDIHAYEKALAAMAHLMGDNNEWARLKDFVPSASSAPSAEPLLKPIKVVTLSYNVPAALHQIDRPLLGDLPRRDLHLAIVLERQEHLLRTLELDPLLAEIVASECEGESLMVCLHRFALQNPFVHTDGERNKWVGEVLDLLTRAGLVFGTRAPSLRRDPALGPLTWGVS